MSLGPHRPTARLPFSAKNVFHEQSPSAKPESGVVGTPPKKRAVPLDDVHVRNMPEYSKRKRSHAYLYDAAMRGSDAQGNVAISPPHPTTTRIDRSTRVSREERYQREQQKAQSQRQWKVAFGRAFPKFVFYLDGLDEAQTRTFSPQIAQLGASVEDFFSRSVTHVVTTRSIPLVRDEKENSATTERRTRKHDGSGIAPPRIVMPTAPPAGVPLHSDRNPMDEWTQPLPANDLLYKAQHFGMKIWRIEKLEHILSLLLAADAPAGMGAEPEQRQALSEMLMQEKLHGTTERDPLAMRSDVHYFGKQSYHILVTDATGEHRPVLVQEYDRHAHEGTGRPPPWPELHGDVEGRGLFVYVDPKERKRLAQLEPRPQGQPTLRRTASMHLPLAHPLPATPELMASDNSMALASTVASTTSTTLTSQTAGVSSTQPDKRVLELHRRLHTPVERPKDGHGVIVQRMLHGLMEGRDPTLRRSRSTGSVPRKAQQARDKKPGHCENCRCRFDDFYEHTRSRRHRKFALDESNFVSIDELLQRVQREPAGVSQWSDYADDRLPQDDTQHTPPS